MKWLSSRKSDEGPHGGGQSIEAQKEKRGGSSTLLRYFVTRTSDENDAEEPPGSAEPDNDITPVALKK
jgi:hypothetical protein